MLKSDIDRTPASRRTVSFAAVALLSVTIPLAGFQAFADTFSTVAGVVSDPHGGLVSEVTVTLANPRRASRYEVRTDAAGQYEFVGVPPGDYVLEAERAGFKRFRHGISVARSDLRRDIALQIGSVRENIVVAGVGAERERVTAADSDAQDRFERDLAECRAAGASAGGGRLRPPRKIRHVAPRYPDSLRTGGTAETVTLEARIDTQGRVADVQPVGDAPADLVAAAIEAVNAWQFQPTLLNCEPVDVWMTVSIEFRPSLKPTVSIEVEPSPEP